MANQRALHVVTMIITVWLLYAAPNVHGWGKEGHEIICKIAQVLILHFLRISVYETKYVITNKLREEQTRLDETAAKAVKELLPESAEGDLSSLCLWADRVKFRYHWSAPLHYINTPDACSYQYNRDCKDEDGEKGRCVAGAIYNYTTQLLSYNTAASSQSQYNLTEALLFVSHFMGDIHQPLHVGFASDKGGNTIDVHWYRRKANLHHIWDSNIIETAEADLYNSELEGMVEAIKKNITTEWADQVKRWESCTKKTACPDIYASEGIQAACDWAYKGVTAGDTLDDDYFYSRLPIVYQRLAQGGVRLAATLNRIFG